MKEYSIKKEFTVDLNKFKDFHPLVNDDAYDSALDEDVYDEKEMSVTLRSDDPEHKFDAYFEDILDPKNFFGKKKEKTRHILDEQKHELLYLYTILKRIPTKSSTANSSIDDGKEILDTYIKLLESGESFSDHKSYKFKLIVEEGNIKGKILQIPVTTLPKQLYFEILDTVIKHHYANWGKTDFGKFLMLRKKPVTLSYLNEMRENWSKPKLGRKNEINPSYEAYLIYKHIKTFPQFPNGRREHSILSEQQGRFIQRFLVLFGITNKTYKVKIHEFALQDDVSFNKKLRADLKKYKKHL